MSSRTWSPGFLLLCLAVGCGVTNTGNPTASGGSAPEGTTLVRSALHREEHPSVSQSERDTFATDSRAFAFALYGQLKDEPGNLFFSPYSISTALAMTYAGAKGPTKQEMGEALHFSLQEPDLHVAFNATDLALTGRASELAGEGSTGDGFTLKVTNAELRPSGTRLRPELPRPARRELRRRHVPRRLRGPPRPEAATDQSWVADQTEQRIEQLLPEGSITADVALVLVNAIYFKASWLDKFDKTLTQDAAFHAPSGDVSVPMMHGRAESYMRGADYKALELPYISDAVRMLFILPDDGAFDAVEGRLDESLFAEARQGLAKYNVDVQLPRFSFRSDVRLGAVLSALGMQLAFGPGADLSGISGAPGDLTIDEVYHQGFVAVDEDGTEAAAATAVVARETSLPPPAEFFANRPFLFFVYDDPTGQVLFSGRLVQPEG